MNEVLSPIVRKIFSYSEDLNAFFQLSLKLSLAFGAWTIFSYSISEGILPDFSSAAAMLGIIFLTVCFALIFIIGNLYGAFSTLWLAAFVSMLMRLLTKREARLIRAVDSWILIFGSVLVCALFTLLLWIAHYRSSLNHMQYLIICFFGIGLFVNFLFSLDITPPPGKDGMPRQKLTVRKKLQILLIVILSMSLLLSSFKGMLTFSFALAGLRSNASDSLLIKESDYRKVEKVLSLYGLSGRACWIDGERWLLKDSIAVWHGLGQTSFIRVVGGEHYGKPTSLTIPVSRSALDLISAENLPFPQCH